LFCFYLVLFSSHVDITKDGMSLPKVGEPLENWKVVGYSGLRALDLE
jgi:hypothetical protein